MTADYTEADWSWDDHDTTVGAAPELSETERARLDAIEAAQPAPESLRERVARAILDSWYPDRNSPARALMHPERLGTSSKLQPTPPSP
jgi:hypothetical protein